MPGEFFPPVVGEIIADPSGWLAGMTDVIASTEAMSAAVEASLTGTGDVVETYMGVYASTFASIDAINASFADSTVASMGTAEAAIADYEATISGFVAEQNAAMAEASASSSSFAASVGETAAAAGAGLASIGRKATLAGIAVGVASVYMASNFQAQMLLIQTQAGASADEVTYMSQAVLGLSGEVAASPKKLADALFPIESVGLRGAQALDVLRLAAEGAKIGDADLTDTANALAAVISSGIPGVNNATDAMAAMNSIVGLGKMRLENLNSAFSSGILDSAHTFGVSIQSVGAALDTMTSSGVPAEQAATRLRMAMALMAAPTKESVKILESLGMTEQEANQSANAMSQVLAKAGVSVSDLANDMRQPNGLMVAMQDLKSHMEGAGLSAEEQAAVISRAFGGGRMGTAILGMFNHIDEMQQKFDGITTDSVPRFEQAWEDTKNTFKFQWDQMVASVQKLLTELGTKLLPIITSVIHWFREHKDVAIALAAAIGGTLTAAVIAFGIAFIAANWEIILAVAIIGALIGVAVWAYQHFEKFHEIVDALGRGFASAFQWVKEFATALWNHDWAAAGEKISQLWENIKGWVSMAGGWLREHLVEWGKAFGDWVIHTALPWLGKKLGELIVWWYKWLYGTALPWLVAHLVEWGKAFGDWVVTTAIPWLLQKLGEFMSWLGGWITGTALPWILDHVVEWAGAFANWVTDTALPWLGEHLAYFLGWLVGWILGLPVIIYELMLNAAHAIADWVVNSALPWMIEHTLALESALMNFLLSLPGKILGWVVGIAQSVISWAIDAAQQAPGKLADIGSKIMDWALGLPGQILGWIGDLGSTLWQAGQDLIGGLIRGITDALGGLADSLGSVGSFIADHKGPPAKDRVLLIPAGRLIMQGLNEGLMTGFEDTKKVLGYMTDAIEVTPVVGGPQRKQMASGLNMPQDQQAKKGGDTYIHVEVSTNADPQEIANAIAWKMR